MDENKEMYQRAHDRLSGMHEKLSYVVGRSGRGYAYTATGLAISQLDNLAYAAKEGNLRKEQYAYVLETPRSELLCEFLTEARTLWEANRSKYGLRLSTQLGESDSAFDWTKLRRNVYRLSKEQLCNRHCVNRHSDGYKISDPGDEYYTKFLKENNLTELQGAETNLPSTPENAKANPPSIEDILQSDKSDALKKRALRMLVLRES